MEGPARSAENATPASFWGGASLREQVGTERRSGALEPLNEAVVRLSAEVVTLEKQRTALMLAAAFYANKKNWPEYFAGPVSWVIEDGGVVARAVLVFVAEQARPD